MTDLLFADESYRIMGAMFEVYKEMGCGFLEPVYQECVEMELAERGIPFTAQLPLMLSYKNRPLKSKYIPDIICFESIIVELKALQEINNDHRSQVHNYLKATGFRLGILVNFGHQPKLQYERIVR